MGSNHLITLVNDTLSLLDRTKIDEPTRLLTPLLSASLDNILHLRDTTLTNPMSRKNVTTLATHLRTLQTSTPDIVAAYVTMAHRTAEQTHASKHLDATQEAKMIETLEQP